MATSRCTSALTASREGSGSAHAGHNAACPLRLRLETAWSARSSKLWPQPSVTGCSRASSGSSVTCETRACCSLGSLGQAPHRDGSVNYWTREVAAWEVGLQLDYVRT